MKLLVDIGNTNTSIAILHNKKIVKQYFLHTSRKNISTAAFKRLLRTYIEKIDQVFIVSVVPKFLVITEKVLRGIFSGKDIFVAGRDIKVPIANKYQKPSAVGQDRLVTAYAAFSKYGCPVLIIDFGTAVTFDLVNKKGEYEGGLIFPGTRLGLSALTQNAALLPKTSLKPERGLIGRNTRGSINKGILYGYAALCDGMIDKFKSRYGRSLKVVATGGDAALVKKYSTEIGRIDPDLLFAGLSLMLT